MKVLVILGSVREARIGDRVCKFIVKTLTSHGHSVDVADPQKMDIPLLKNPIQFYPKPDAAPQPVQDYNAMVVGADAYVLVTAEYNRQMPPALTNLIDHAPPKAYAFKTSGIVSYSMGPGGGVCAFMQARGFLTEMGAPPIPSMFTIGTAHKGLDEEGNVVDENITTKAEAFMKQFNWYATALKKQREAQPPV